MDAIQLEHVTKRFGDFTAVNDVSLSVPEGSIYGFIGPNGSGKTTTLRMIMNILRPDSGNGAVFGHPPPAPARDGGGHPPAQKGGGRPPAFAVGARQDLGRERSGVFRPALQSDEGRRQQGDPHLRPR